ncbi:anti-sigma B factor RsbT [Desmospora sp. 8437]|uniref:Serine/threonine-protein kinase RsbT n=1 Tax=Kroppenstedtia eburnea TaxID=714067 RepID=A0A1N7PMJ1_9BACL|nr:anti-sigma B factor RsbT [Desmospora sp. 8437]SIT11776.1 serine/threonine-protein kinase RsbT [Kroppenstedtia eburnea]
MLSILIPIKTESDVVTIRSKVREITGGLGFDELDQSRIVQSVSELALNVVHHAEEGTVLIEPLDREGRRGIRMVVQDFGPGMAETEPILRMSETPSVVEGHGLRQVRELMDEFVIRAVNGKGTCVQVSKWLTVAAMEVEE